MRGNTPVVVTALLYVRQVGLRARRNGRRKLDMRCGIPRRSLTMRPQGVQNLRVVNRGEASGIAALASAA